MKLLVSNRILFLIREGIYDWLHGGMDVSMFISLGFWANKLSHVVIIIGGKNELFHQKKPEESIVKRINYFLLIFGVFGVFIFFE